MEVFILFYSGLNAFTCAVMIYLIDLLIDCEDPLSMAHESDRSI